MPAVIQDKVDPEISSEDEDEDQPCIIWSGLSRKVPVLVFHAEAIVSKDGNIRSVGERYNLTFKIVRTESRLVRSILTGHGFHEVHPNSSDFNLMWTGSHLKLHLLRSLQDFQKVNHFPRSYELTRKDRLYKNIQRMQQLHGFKCFHIVPQTFLLPAEYQDFCSSCLKDRGPWIVKPVASSRGRGIYLVSNPNQVPLDENILVSRYISEPLLIDDFKFDLRLYVLVTSYEPLIVYLYEEGLARFATVKYERSVKNIRNQFMHLTNYSVNKKSSDYVSCDDPEVEDYGNKWSMSAMLRYLKQEGKDTTSLMTQVEDLVIKAVLSAELQIATACKSFVPHRTNCFELYGFDVLIDSNLKPWLLEVNLSPSLACDAPLDLKIKASMISDMFSLVGFVCQDPLLRQTRPGRGAPDLSSRSQARKTQRPHSAQPASANTRPQQRPRSANEVEPNGMKDKPVANEGHSTLGLTTEELKVLRRTKEEHERRGGFIRIFPTTETWELYSGYLEYKTSMNCMLASRLFPERSRKLEPLWKSRCSGTGREAAAAVASHAFRAAQYERKLLSLEARKRKRQRAARNSVLGRKRAGRRRTASTPDTSDGEGGSAEDREMEGEETEDGNGGATRPSGDPQVPVMPTLPQPTSKINLLHILQDGWELSKVQARITFSSYLRRVQVRLLAECRGRRASAWQDRDHDQMELVMRFLKRAANNLRPELRISLPNPRLPPADRRRLLTLQLGDFIQCYDKETEQMRPTEEARRLDPHVFREFVAKASESDLEEVLTFYAQKNRSASVFLGTRRRNSGGHAEPRDGPAHRDVPGSKGKSAAQGPPRPATPQSRIQAPWPPATSPTILDCPHVELQCCQPPTPPQPTCEPQSEEPALAGVVPTRRGWQCFAPPSDVPVSSVPGALQIYSQRMSRPISARPASRKANPGRPMPDSAGGAKEPSQSPSNPNQQAIIAALQRLAEKQASRQYAASSHISLLTQHLTNLNLASGACGRGAITLNTDLRDTASSHGPPRAVHLKTRPTGTGRTWHEDTGPPDGESRSREPDTRAPPPPLSPQHHQAPYQLQFAIQQLQQQEVQSQQLLELSRARHQAALSSQTSAAPLQGFSEALALPLTALPSWQSQTSVPGTLPFTPKPPSCARDGLIRKTAPQCLHRQAQPEVWASGAGSSAQHAIHKAVCRTGGLSIHRKLFQSQGPKNR